MSKEKVTISIPKHLYNEIKKEIENTGFSSPSEWIKYVLRQALAGAKKSNNAIISFPYLGESD